jgi:hypothetical protein
MIKLGMATGDNDHLPVTVPTDQVEKDIKDNSRPDHADHTLKPVDYPNISYFVAEDWSYIADEAKAKKILTDEIFMMIKDEKKSLYYKIGNCIINVARYLSV